MTDLEIHQALLAAVTAANDMSDGDRAMVLDEVNRHKVGCRPAPWRDCPVITHYAARYRIDLDGSALSTSRPIAASPTSERSRARQSA